jgi:hypothetical protein
MMLNWFMATFQFFIGIVHFFAVFVRAGKSSLNMDSSLEKEPRSSLPY